MHANATDTVFFVLMALVYVIGQFFKAKREKAQREQDALAAQIVTPSPPPARGAAQTFVNAPLDALRNLVLARFADTAARAKLLAEQVRQDPRNQRFLDVLERWIPGRAQGFGQWMAQRTDAVTASQGRLAADGLDLVLAEVTELVRQRRDGAVRDMVGEADTLADACYGPIVAFARAHDLPLASAFPATQWTEFNLSIWTGFAATSIAPIFLPPGFFTCAAWWPGLAHEIGHDFLVSLPALDLRLRAQLGVPTEREGALPMQRVEGPALALEARRLYGAWFEETFCDVFGTLMCGPGYVASMIELFAPDDDDDRDSVREVDIAPGTYGLYDHHPPRHLRVLTCLAVLERIELHDDARALARRWKSLSDLPGEAADVIVVPTATRVEEVPTEVFMARATELVDALCAGQLEALAGYSLTDIPGLDYGPHEHGATLRARTALLAGRAPDTRDPRCLIAGAVLAALEQPAREAQVLAAARAMIPSLGALQNRPDAYAQTTAPSAHPTHAALVDAIVLNEILGPPRARRQGGKTATSRV